MIDKLKNNGMVILNPQVGEKEKTIIVSGVARSGTSMVAQVLEEMGVFMGNEKNNSSYEDIQIARLMEDGSEGKNLKRFIQKRNQEFEVWGFKRPKAVEYIHGLEHQFRNPYYIILFRDILAISIRNNISVGTKLLPNLKKTHQRIQKVLEFLSQTDKPCLLISYEKALLNREYFIKYLATFVGLEANDERILKAINGIQLNKPQYLYSSRLKKFSGEVVACRPNGKLVGWATHSVRKKEPIELELWIDKQNVANFIADLPNAQFLPKKGNGKRKGMGFRFNIVEYLPPGKKAEIIVKVKEDGTPLNFEPLMVKLS